jgi:hypothetical protein
MPPKSRGSKTSDPGSIGNEAISSPVLATSEHVRSTIARPVIVAARPTLSTCSARTCATWAPRRSGAGLADADALYRQLGLELAVANNTHSRADLALDRGDGAAALGLYRQALEVVRSLGVDRSVAYCLAGMASVLATSGQDAEAARIWGAVSTAEETLGFRMLAPERRRYENHLARLEGTPA